MTKTHKPARARVLETFAVFAAAAQLAAILTQRRHFSFLALGLLFMALFMKRPAAEITFWWLRFSAILSGVTNRIILTLLFFLILTPIALVYRLFNKDPLNLERDDSGSFYSERNHTYLKNDLEKMW